MTISGINGQTIPRTASIVWVSAGFNWHVVARFPYHGVNAVVPLVICYSPREAAETADILRDQLAG
jgi:hypothetical protein